MYAIKTQDGRYYNGRANLSWEQLVTKDVLAAFWYSSKQEAERKASKFTGFNSAGFIFTVEEVA